MWWWRWQLWSRWWWRQWWYLGSERFGYARVTDGASDEESGAILATAENYSRILLKYSQKYSRNCRALELVESFKTDSCNCRELQLTQKYSQKYSCNCRALEQTPSKQWSASLCRRMKTSTVCNGIRYTVHCAPPKSREFSELWILIVKWTT